MNDDGSGVRFPLKTLPLAKFCALTGYTPGAIRQKIHRAQWAEGVEFCRDPHGHIHVIVEGYEKWIRKGVSKAGATASALPSSTGTSAAAKL